MELTAIPGVGEKTAEALRELEAPETAVTEGDVATLARAPGISPARAALIARRAIQHRHDDPGDFLATDRAEELYEALLDLVQSYAVTDYARRRLTTFYPSGTASRIEEARAYVADAREREPAPAIDDALTGVEPLAPAPTVTVRDRCLATSDAETYARAQERVPSLSVEMVESAQQLRDVARGYGTVIALDGEFAGLDIDGDVRVEPDALSDPDTLVPERTLAFFGRNRERIEAAIAVHRAADLPPPCSMGDLESLLEGLEADGTLAGDDEIDRLRRASDDLDAAVSTATSVANDHVREAIEERDVTVEGADLLSMVERGASVESLLERELADEFETALDMAREQLIDALELTDDEADLARRVFPERTRFPIERDDDALERLRTHLEDDRERRERTRRQERAAALAAYREEVDALVEAALELDVELAIARFDRALSCTMPRVEGDGIALSGGQAPTLDVPIEDVEPVDYEVEGVTLLTGVNSGGKTSTLDLLATVTILAHMGFPVPAEHARVQRFDRLHYHAKTQGTLDAGAFETTVREFARLARRGSDSLVLVDELESITEPGASAKLIAGFLERLVEGDATAVFVTHLAEEIREAARIELAVDGIAAEGLADGELVVDRSPRKDHLARSTPELIVEKLAGEADDPAFYESLLSKFDDGA